jgi:hypothetical protein
MTYISRQMKRMEDKINGIVFEFGGPADRGMLFAGKNLYLTLLLRKGPATL